MQRTRRNRAKTTARQNRLGWRQWVAMFALLAFSFQVQITQIHVHFASSFNLVEKSATAQKIAPGKNLPANDNPATCPICQAVLHGGQFITPSAMALALPGEAVTLIPIFLAAAVTHDAVSHSWQGRAPPHA